MSRASLGGSTSLSDRRKKTIAWCRSRPWFTSENKVYRQGIADPKELADGFPSRPEDLFTYQGLIIGSVEAGYFTPLQQELIREFVDRRGGGLLLLGGQFALADGGWNATNLTDLLPTTLPTEA